MTMPRILFAWTVLLVLVACSPSQPGGSDPLSDKGDVSVDGNGQGSDLPVDLPWNPFPEAVVVSAETSGGFVPALYVTNGLADARIWGDGRYIWVVNNDDGSRSVYEGYLSQEQLLAITNQFENADFFGMQDQYANDMVADAPDRCLRVQLIDRVKQVCEYVEGAPPAFHTLYELVVSGAGVDGELYVPSRGYVVTYVLGQAAGQASQADVQLSEDAVITMADYLQGAWADGPILAAAWDQVNLRPFGMVVQQGQTYYQVSVQVPGLSLVPPPDTQ